MVAIVLLLLGILVKAAIHSIDSKNYDSALFRIIIDYLHTLMIIRNYDLNWPETLEWALDTFTIVGQANDKIFSIDCYIKGKSTQPVMVSKLILALLAPAVVFILMYLLWNLCCVCYFTREQERNRIQGKIFSIFEALKEESLRISKMMPSKREEVQRHIYISTSVILYLSYPLLCMKAFSVFQCITLDKGEQFLFEQLDIPCWDKQHSLWISLLAIPTILIWIIGKTDVFNFLIGVPLFTFFKIFRKRRDLDKKEQLYHYGFWYNAMKDKYYYWEFLGFLKKFLLILNYKIITNHNAIYKLSGIIGGILYVIMDLSGQDDLQLDQREYFKKQVYSPQSYMFMCYIILQNLYFLVNWVREYMITIKSGILRKNWPILIRRIWVWMLYRPLNWRAFKVDYIGVFELQKLLLQSDDGKKNDETFFNNLTQQNLLQTETQNYYTSETNTAIGQENGYQQAQKRLSLLMVGVSQNTNLMNFFDEENGPSKQLKILRNSKDTFKKNQRTKNKINSIKQPQIGSPLRLKNDFDLKYDDYHLTNATSLKENSQKEVQNDVDLKTYIQFSEGNLMKKIIDQQFQFEDMQAEFIQKQRIRDQRKKQRKLKGKKQQTLVEYQDGVQTTTIIGHLGNPKRGQRQLPQKFWEKQKEMLENKGLDLDVSSESYNIFDDSSESSDNKQKMLERQKTFLSRQETIKKQTLKQSKSNSSEKSYISSSSSSSRSPKQFSSSKSDKSNCRSQTLNGLDTHLIKDPNMLFNPSPRKFIISRANTTNFMQKMINPLKMEIVLQLADKIQIAISQKLLQIIIGNYLFSFQEDLL
ncbi:UNKNOWN [Stylonychia lemnae]|uniref:Transmembrane protein n=1 Tax=Stylonychia lemnae TaxID=5949 RepID=A0A078ARI1_STYLE|nr:UNKNOWN [Stylonychia lemnae]|eukprot:CDW85070.1 UNKNOWN [Stylonychia lemnae]